MISRGGGVDFWWDEIRESGETRENPKAPDSVQPRSHSAGNMTSVAVTYSYLIFRSINKSIHKYI